MKDYEKFRSLHNTASEAWASAWVAENELDMALVAAKKAAAAMSAAEFELNLWKAMPLQIAARKAWAAAREAAEKARTTARSVVVEAWKARDKAEKYMREFSQGDFSLHEAAAVAWASALKAGIELDIALAAAEMAAAAMRAAAMRAAMRAAEFEFNSEEDMAAHEAAAEARAAAREAAGKARAAARAAAVDTLKARAEAEEYMREFSQRDSGAARQKPEPELDMNKPAGN